MATRLKFYTASITPAGLRTAGETADGVLPIFYSPEKPEIVTDSLLEGMREAGREATLQNFDIAPYVRTRWATICRRAAMRSGRSLRCISAAWVRGRRISTTTLRATGLWAAAKKIQDLFLDGQKNEAAAAVPDALIDEISLVGSADRIQDRLHAWKDARDAHVGTMVLTGIDRGDARGGRGAVVGCLPR